MIIQTQKLRLMRIIIGIQKQGRLRIIKFERNEIYVT